MIETSAKNSVVPVATSNVKLKDHMVRLKITSLYTYKELRPETYDLRSNESRDQYY